MSRYVDISIYFGSKRIKANIAVFLLSVLFIALFVAACVWGSGTMGSPVAGMEVLRYQMKEAGYVIHAGGELELNGEMLSYTNSLEALQNCYDKGNRFCEIDFLTKEDGSVICAHDEETASKYEGMLTQMSLDDLARFVASHRDLMIVTDVKDDNVGICTRIRELYPYLCDNLIVQIYHKDEYEPIKKLGFRYIIYTLYNEGEDGLKPDALTEFVSSADLAGVTFWESFPEEHKESFDALIATGVPLFIHTVNDRDEMERFMDMGITGIYTDVADYEGQYHRPKGE